MLVTEVVEIIAQKDEIREIVCNACSKRISITDECFFIEQNNFHTITVDGGYGSEYPQDLEIISFELCSECLRKITSSFKIAPSSKHLMLC